MSVSGVVSPMSVMSIDKSQVDLDVTLPRNDRERFFEVVEYQTNILQYFRENEVRFFFIDDKKTCFIVHNLRKKKGSCL